MAEGAPAPGAPSRAERDEARRRAGGGRPGAARRYARGRPSIDERPPAPWGSFPLSELAVFVAIVLIIGSFIVGRRSGAW